MKIEFRAFQGRVCVVYNNKTGKYLAKTSSTVWVKFNVPASEEPIQVCQMDGACIEKQWRSSDDHRFSDGRNCFVRILQDAEQWEICDII